MRSSAPLLSLLVFPKEAPSHVPTHLESQRTAHCYNQLPLQEVGYFFRCLFCGA